MTRRKKWLITCVIVLGIALTGVLYAYGLYHEARQMGAKAIQDLQIDSKVLTSEQFQAQLRLAASCLDADPEETIKGCTVLIDEGKKSSKAYSLRGDAFVTLKRYDEAIQDYTTAFQLDPKSTNPDVMRGEIEDTKNEIAKAHDQRDKAISYYTSAIEHSPPSIEAYQRRGSDYLLQGQYDLALNDFNHAIEIDSKNTPVADPHPLMTLTSGWHENSSSSLYVLRGLTYRDKGNYDLALQDFNQALKAQGCCTAMIYGDLQNTNFLKGDFPAAIEASKHLIHQNPAKADNVIWLHLERIRVGQDDSREFKHNSKKTTPSAWQKSVLAYLAGSMTADELMEKSADSNIDAQKQSICADNFYIGEVLLAKHDNKGLEYLHATDQTCSAKDTYHIAANAELARVTVSTGK